MRFSDIKSSNPNIIGLKGLDSIATGVQNTPADNQYAQVKNNYNNPYKLGQYVELSDAISAYTPKSLFELHDEERNKNIIREQIYDQIRAEELKKYGQTNHTAKIQEIAEKVSPYYKKYAFDKTMTGGEYIKFSDNQWTELAANYQADLAASGEKTANDNLNKAIQTEVSKNQPLLEKLTYGLRGFGTSFGGSLISFAGMFKGAVDYAIGNGEDNKNLPWYIDFLNSAVDNNWTRYGTDVMNYGSLYADDIQRAKELGISNQQIVETAGQEYGTDSFFDQIVNINTPFKLLQQAGFTSGAIAEAAATSAIGGMAFKGLKYGTLGLRAAGVLKTAEAAKNTIRGLQRAENIFQKIVVPGLVGSGEGVIEGLETKREVLENGYNYLKEKQQEVVQNDVMQMVKDMQLSTVINQETGEVAYVTPDGKQVRLEALYDIAFNNHKNEFDASTEAIDTDATIAGVNNFLLNSLINGVMNTTLKAGLQSNKTREMLKNSKLFGWAQPRGNFNVVQGADGTFSVNPKLGIGKSIFNIVKEPAGEFTEEYLQTLSDAVSQAGASNNIHDYIDKKYSGRATAQIGDWLSSDFSAAWTTLSEKALDQEAMKAGVMGALGSMMGSVAKPKKAIGADGKRTFFGKEVNSEGEQQSNLERWLSIPERLGWRSGLLAEFNKSRQELRESKAMAKSLEEWLNDPKNKGKFDGVNGTLAWAQDMDSKAKLNDEFGYRNSVLGKTINDIFMLKQLEGTDFYNSLMDRLTSVAAVEENSEEAKQLVDQIRNNADSSQDFANSSDQQVVGTLKKNAMDMLNYIQKVEEESDNLEKTFPRIDEDTKQSLVYSRIAKEDFRERIKLLEEETSAIHSNILEEEAKQNSLEDQEPSNISKQEKRLLARFGSLEEARKAYVDGNQAIAELEEKKKKLQSEIENLKKNTTVRERQKDSIEKKEKEVKAAKAALKSLQRQTKSLGKELSKAEEERKKRRGTEVEGRGTDTILSIQDLLSLDQATLASILYRGNRRFYQVTHQNENEEESTTESRNYYTEEQQRVIERLLSLGRARDSEYLNKMVDLVKLKNTLTKFDEQETAIMLNRDNYFRYVQAQKRAAANVLVKKTFEALNAITDYEEFANAMDDLQNKFDDRQVASIVRSLKKVGNQNFERFYKGKNNFQEILDIISKDAALANSVDSNSLDLFVYAVQYLSNKGINVDSSNIDEVTRALSEEDNEGNNLFESYINSINSKVSEETNNAIPEVVFTSTDEVIDDMIHLLDGVQRVKDERASNNRSIEVTVTSEEKAPPTPPAPIVEKPATPEETKDDDESNLQSKSEPTPLEDEVNDNLPNDQKSFLDQIQTKNNKRIRDAFESLFKTIEAEVSNDSEASKVLSTYKKDAEDVIYNLGNRTYSTEESLVNALQNAIDNVNHSNSNKQDSIIYLLERALNELKQTRGTRARQEASERRRSSSSGRNPNSGTIRSKDMQELLTQHPDSPLSKFIISHNIIDFLKYGFQDMLNASNGDVEIYFYSDPVLTEQVRQDLGDNYSDNALPIIAVVKSDEGSININGEHYQPIAIMPDTGSDTSGSNRMKEIRDKVNKENEGLVMYEKDGEIIPVKATPNGKKGCVTAAHPDAGTSRENTAKNNNNLLSLIEETLTPEEQEEEADSRNRGRGFTRAMQKAIRRCIERLSTEGGKLFYTPDALNGREGNPIRLFVKSIDNYENKDGKTLYDVLDEGDPIAIKNYNSRTRRLYREVIDKITDRYTKLKAKQDSAGVTPEDIEDFVEFVNNILNSKFRNSIYIGTNYNFSIQRATEDDGNYPKFEVTLTNEKDSSQNFNLGSIDNSNLNNLGQTLLSNILSIPSEENKEFAHQQVSFNNAETANIEGATNEQGVDLQEMAINDLEELIADNLLEVAASSLDYVPSSVTINAPFSVGETDATVYDTSTDNASSIGTAGSGEISVGGTIVDDSSGTVVEGEESNLEPSNDAISSINDIINRIKENSSKLVLLEDGSGYINKETGRIYARVTNVEYTEEAAGEEFNANSPWVLPSTTIGNIVDRIVRDFFEGAFNINDFGSTANSRVRYATINNTLGVTDSSNLKLIDIEVTENGLEINADVEGTNFTVIVNEENGSYQVNDNFKVIVKGDNGEQEIYAGEDAKAIAPVIFAENSPLLNEGIKKKDVTTKHGITIKNDSQNKVNLEKFLEDQHIESLHKKYPNISEQSLNALINRLTTLKNYWEAEGWHISADGIKAIGTVALSSEGQSINVDTAGTLDILLYNDKGQARVVDIKTVHVNSDYTEEDISDAIEDRRNKWETQTTLYSDFINSQYGLKFLDSEILCIPVVYPAPNNKNTYKTEETGQDNLERLLLNDQELSVDIVDYKENTEDGLVPLKRRSLSFMLSKANDKLKKIKILQDTIGELTSVDLNTLEDNFQPSETSSETSIDPITGGESFEFTGFDDDAMIADFDNVISIATVVAPSGIAWENLTDDIRNSLTSRGYTKESWDNNPISLQECLNNKSCRI